MPNTKSAERRMRSNARKEARNHSTKSYLHSLERKLLASIKGGKKDEVTKGYRDFCSAFDKAVKAGAVHAATASRKKSRLAVRVNAAGKK